MKKAIVALSICIAAAPLAVMAQGEVGGVKQPPPVSKPSPDDKAAGKAMRKAEGSAAIKQQPPGEVGPTKGQPPNTPSSTESRAAVKSEAKAANRAGEADKGGQVGPTK